ncbi:MAG: DUF3106 domain-containing protein [Zoogloea sp.]|nr:DUF3106 domain-containing protein [Zoogloea sp.]
MNCKPRCLKYVVLAVVGILAAGAVVMGLWNWLIPGLFGWKEIGFVQAIGLLVLSRILFGGFRCREGWHARRQERLAARMAQMSPEERERFQAGMKSWCGCRKPAAAPSQE